MAQKGRFRCLICAARVGQLVPFCEWCGAKHACADGVLVLTGAICQGCGFQADMPFSRCPKCRTERRVLCPACTAPVPVRTVCHRCGLHFLFFDKARREHSRGADRRPAPALGLAARKCAFLIFLLALGVGLDVSEQPRWMLPLLVTGLSAALGLLLWRVERKRPRHGRESGPVEWMPVLESYDLAEAIAARGWLRQCGIDCYVMLVKYQPEAASSPPSDLRRLMVRGTQLTRARFWLTEHGFDPNPNSLARTAGGARGLRLVSNARPNLKPRPGPRA